MRKILTAAMCVVLLFSSGTNRTYVQSEDSVEEIQVQGEAKEDKPDFSLYAKAAVLMDADSGRVLYEKDGNTHMPNASTTKILTCILAIESGKLGETVTASSYAASMPKVHLGMQTGENFRLEDLLYSLMLESHNDSAVAIAEYLGQTVEGFAAMMNEKARQLGCEDTYFITPNGLDAKDDYGVHGTTARDLSLIMSYCIQNETFLSITRTASYSFSNIEGTRSYSCNNHNAFLTMMEGALSGKTGFTGNAGYCYVGSLRRGDRTFVVALLACGWPNNKSYKWADTKALMNYALDNYNYEEVFEHGKTLEEIKVENAVPKTGRLHENRYLQPFLADDSLSILKNDSESIRVVYDLPETLEAPVKSGTKIGTATYYLDELCIATYPVTAEESIQKLDFRWYLDYVLQLFFMENEYSGF